MGRTSRPPFSPRASKILRWVAWPSLQHGHDMSIASRTPKKNRDEAQSDTKDAEQEKRHFARRRKDTKMKVNPPLSRGACTVYVFCDDFVRVAVDMPETRGTGMKA